MIRVPADRVSHIVAASLDGLAAAYRDAFAERRLAWASPPVLTVGAYVGFYGIGLVLSGPSSNLPAMVVAVALGFVGLLAGIGLGWKAISGPTRRKPVARQLLVRYGYLLLGVGLVALVAYFANIGYVPLFQSGLEQARVDAATEGGAPLRVISLLALPGVWILVAEATAVGSRRGIILAVLAVAVVALGFALTGNRSPSFTAIEVGLVTGLLAAGMVRLGGRGVALLAVGGFVLVLGAGLFGAFRLASSANYRRPAEPTRPIARLPSPDSHHDQGIPRCANQKPRLHTAGSP